MQHTFHVLPSIPNEFCAKCHGWVSMGWKLPKGKFWHFSRDKFYLVWLNSCFGWVLSTFTIDFREVTVEWTPKKNKESALLKLCSGITLMLCRKNIWILFFSLCWGLVYVCQSSYGILFKISRFSEHINWKSPFSLMDYNPIV